MKRQRKPSLLDPNVQIAVRNVSKPSPRNEGQENQTKKRKKPVYDDAVARKVLVTSSRPASLSTACSSQKIHERASIVIDEWLLTPTYFEDILDAEINLGSRIKLSKSFCNNPLFVVTPYHREVAIEWLIDIQGDLKIGNDALHLAVTLMDVVLDSIKINEDEIQAVAAAAMWLAHKFLYGAVKASRILNFCEGLSREQLLLNERRILKVTKMNLMFTNPITILNSQLFCVFGKDVPPVEYHMSNYLLEIMLLVVDFARDSIAKRAVVAMETTLRLLESRPDVEQKHILRGSSALIVHKRLLSTLRTIWNSPSFRSTSSLFHKYSSSSKQWVSLHHRLDPDFFES